MSNRIDELDAIQDERGWTDATLLDLFRYAIDCGFDCLSFVRNAAQCERDQEAQQAAKLQEWRDS